MRAVSRYRILGTPADGTFDRVARLAASWFGTPIATVTIVDDDRIWFKAAHGLEGVRQIDRAPGLCASAILCDRSYVVADARTGPRTAQNPLVHGELGVRFYAAAPITTADGYRLGTVDVLDTRPREASPADLSVLEDLASVVMDLLELRLSALTTVRAERDPRLQVERDRHVLAELATTLQRTVLPPSLPAIEGIELACHYHAASSQQGGGNFYDVFHLGDDRRSSGRRTSSHSSPPECRTPPDPPRRRAFRIDSPPAGAGRHRPARRRCTPLTSDPPDRTRYRTGGQSLA
ncbi:GAF domain-containing protein [Rhodococcus sp. 14C212]|nr:GAF domain-containing protein [Rhodococcus sp. 14C212]